MSVSNDQICKRLSEVDWTPSIINEYNRMYGLTSMCNTEQSTDEEEMDFYETGENPLYSDQRPISSENVYWFNWNRCFQNTGSDIEPDLRYDISPWEAEQNNVVVEFNRMNLNLIPDGYERPLQIQIIPENILDQINAIQSQLNDCDLIDENELIRLSEICEKEYYGDVSDSELVQAMDQLSNISHTKMSDSLMSPVVLRPSNEAEWK